MKQFLMGSAAVLAVAIPGAALAQSTGSQDFEDTIVVTGATVDQGVGAQFHFLAFQHSPVS